MYSYSGEALKVTMLRGKGSWTCWRNGGSCGRKYAKILKQIILWYLWEHVTIHEIPTCREQKFLKWRASRVYSQCSWIISKELYNSITTVNVLRMGLQVFDTFIYRYCHLETMGMSMICNLDFYFRLFSGDNYILLIGPTCSTLSFAVCWICMCMTIFLSDED